MLRRRHINAELRARSLRSIQAAADAARWPFERLAWTLEQRLLWPFQERIAGWGLSGSAAGAGGLVALAAAAVVVGFLWPSGGHGSGAQATAPSRVAIVTRTPQAHTEQPRGPTLQGVPPSFEVGRGAGVSKAAGGAAGGLDAEASGVGTESSPETSQPSDPAAATTSSEKPVPAGPAAMKVARRFSEAFVFYEVGERPARAKTVFGETATPQLASALSERPPRLPGNAEVPRARVLNLVPGPRRGKAYTVSVSLLRVGLTSELRLEMEKSAGAWQVTDVRG